MSAGLPGANVDASTVSQLDFNKGAGLIPAVVQHGKSGAILMLGYMNLEALEATLARKRVVFFSRSRRTLWEKGATSGHALDLVSIRTDCDRDTLLIQALPRGPVCHTGTDTCFGNVDPGVSFLATLESVISDRYASRAAAGAVDPPGSYTARLFNAGIKRIAQKVGEEGVETALAGAAGDERELIGESADLLFHLLVLLRSRGLELKDVVTELHSRHGGRS